MNQNHVKQLLTWMENLIREQEQVARQLWELSIPKRQAIINDDIPSLQEIMGREESLLTRLQELEQMRQRVSEELATGAGRTGSLTAEQILMLTQELDPQAASSLKATIQEFTRTYRELIEANQQNSVLIKDALKYIDSMVMVISGSTEGITYSPQGEMGEVTRRGYLNKKV